MAKLQPTNPDYVEHGSNRHAALLGLVRATEEDELRHEGWTLADVTMFGPAARPWYLKRVLIQKVNELISPPLKVQSDDPLAPGYAPPMWVPSEEPVSGMV